MMDMMGKVVPIPLSQLNQGNPPQQTHAIEPILPSKVPEPTHKSENLQSHQTKLKDSHQENPVQTANDKDGPKLSTNLQKPANYEANLQATQPK
jgi:hypothetical protein